MDSEETSNNFSLQKKLLLVKKTRVLLSCCAGEIIDCSSVDSEELYIYIYISLSFVKKYLVKD